MKDNAIKLTHPVLHWLKELFVSSYIQSKFDVTLRGIGVEYNIPFQDNDASMTLVQTPVYDPVNNKLTLKFSVKVRFKHTCNEVVLFMFPKEICGTKITALEIGCSYKVHPISPCPYKAGHWYVFVIEYTLKNDTTYVSKPSDC